jgi:hypothetical protein
VVRSIDSRCSSVAKASQEVGSLRSPSRTTPNRISRGGESTSTCPGEGSSGTCAQPRSLSLDRACTSHHARIGKGTRDPTAVVGVHTAAMNRRRHVSRSVSPGSHCRSGAPYSSGGGFRFARLLIPAAAASALRFPTASLRFSKACARQPTPNCSAKRYASGVP